MVGMKLKRDLLLISLAYLAAHFLATLTGAYGYFRDELYYIACSKHLAWGYVDQPPLSIFLLALNRAVLGDSLFALRFLPAVCGAVFVYVTGLIAAELGGNRFAQGLAALAAAITPVYLSIFDFYSMNSFDLLFCELALFVVLRIINSGNEKLWIVFGMVVGIGLENKWSLVFICAGLGVGLLFSVHRRHLISKWFWFGAVIAALLNLPHLLWQVHNGWPTLEFIRNATANKNLRISLPEFVRDLTNIMNPFNLVMWISGLLGLVFSIRLRSFRFLAIAFAATTAIFLLQNGKPYYLAPFFPVLFGAGAVAIEAVTSLRFKAARIVLVVVLIVGGLIAAPFAQPFVHPAIRNPQSQIRRIALLHSVRNRPKHNLQR